MREERWKHIENLSDLRAKYSCFDDSEEPYYRALSAGIKALKQELCVTMRDLSEEELKHFAEEMKKVRVQVVKQEPILDKIRAEIEQLRLHKAQFLTNDSKVCIDSQEVLNIIDKYKAESEE